MTKILVLHGPNLNLLGEREPEIYGKTTLKAINDALTQLAEQYQHTLKHQQSNAENTLIEAIHDAKRQGVEFIIINPAALTHTSIALRDAFLAVQIPFIEVHISNVFARESFRQQSYLSDIAVGVISGLGPYGYELALQAAIKHTLHNEN